MDRTVAHIIQDVNRLQQEAAALVRQNIKRGHLNIRISGEEISLGEEGDYLTLEEVQELIRKLVVLFDVYPEGKK
jgi:hypothetical protein